MPAINRKSVWVSLCLTICIYCAAAADEKDQAERKAWTKYYVQTLPSYPFVESESNKPLKAIPQAKLRWDNPVREGRTHGELFAWTNEGRGAVVGNILSYDFGENRRRVAHEFHSFDFKDLICKRERGAFKLKGPGVDYQPIPDAPAPAKTRALRLVQMRRLSKYFVATSKIDDVEQPLRPLNQPLFRFDTKKITDDGAIFAYVTGTDPELLVAIVSRETRDGPQWFFGAGRFTDLPLKLKFKDRTMWEFQSWADYEGGYHARHGVDFQPHMPQLQPTAKSTP